MAQRTRVLAEMAQKLMHLAEEKDLAVSIFVQSTVGSCCGIHIEYGMGCILHACNQTMCLF